MTHAGDARRTGTGGYPSVPGVMTYGAAAAGEVLADRYRLEEHVATDTAGRQIWRGVDTVLRRPVALGIRQPGGEAAAGMLTAAVAASRLVHPHLVSVYDAIDEGHRAYLIREWVPGVALRDVLSQGPLDSERATLVTHAVAEAVAALHVAGIVHGNVHPGTILTSMLKRVDVAVYRALEQGLEGSFQPGVLSLGLAEDAVGWALDEHNRALITPEMEAAVAAALASLDRLFKYEIDPAEVAAVIIEPVQGEGGFNAAPPAFMRALRDLCTREGIVFIADEIQCGMGRTGKLFAMEHFGVHADITTLAKSLAGGTPLSAVVGRSEIMDAVIPGGLGSTYAGAPMAIAAAHAVLDIYESEGVIGQGQRFRVALNKAHIQSELPVVRRFGRRQHRRAEIDRRQFDIRRVEGKIRPRSAPEFQHAAFGHMQQPAAIRAEFESSPFVVVHRGLFVELSDQRFLIHRQELPSVGSARCLSRAPWTSSPSEAAADTAADRSAIRSTPL